MKESDRHHVIVYGDDDTVENHRRGVEEMAQVLGLSVLRWFSDAEGLRDELAPAGAPGMVTALAACVACRADLLIPFVVDVPGEQRWRLIANFLHRRGLELRVGPETYDWKRATDPFDLAIRWEHDAAFELDLAVASEWGIEQAAAFLAAGPATAHLQSAPPNALQRRSRPRDGATQARNMPGIALQSRSSDMRALAEQLCGDHTQAVIAAILNDLGFRTATGALWTQPSVSRLLRGRRSPAPARGDADH